MTHPVRQLGPIAATLAVLAYVAGVGRLSMHTAGVEEFRAQSRKAVESLPMQVGEWKGEVQPIPARARDLLKPNAEASILYTRRDGTMAYYSVIQVADARDMTGHAPSNCYRGNGFELDPTETRKVRIGEFEVNAAVYRMKRQAANGRMQYATVYNYFIFPDGTFGHTLLELDRAAEDYRKLKYGVAQVQVLTSNPHLGDKERDEIFAALAGSPQSVEMVRVLRSGLDWFGRRHADETLGAVSALRKGSER